MVYKERKGRLSATEASEGTVDLSSATSLKGSSDRHIMKGVIVDNSIYISYDEGRRPRVKIVQ